MILDLRVIYWHFAGTPFIQPRLPTSEVLDKWFPPIEGRA